MFFFFCLFFSIFNIILEKAAAHAATVVPAAEGAYCPLTPRSSNSLYSTVHPRAEGTIPGQTCEMLILIICFISFWPFKDISILIYEMLVFSPLTAR